VRKELRELLEDMQLLWQQPGPGIGFNRAYMAAKRRADKVALEYAILLEAKDG